MEHFYQSFKSARPDYKPYQSMFSFPRLYTQAVERCRPKGTVVEIGTWVGQSFAYLAVEAINSKKNINIVGIDTFTGLLPGWQKKGISSPQWNIFKKNLEPVWDYITVIRSDSSKAAWMFKDVDFVFIDGDHSYKGVMKDLEAWWPVITTKGIFAGHDLISKNPYNGVKKAVDEFTKKLGLTYTKQERCWVIDRAV